ncbi:AraC family transcriptional regulator [Pelomonas sp. KK5]|uniref:helix-turn-helix domain-containing protein n=1 Tax=Pelomonas sp. KK5 TaxID=1855730 RepID=UPI00097BEDF2|nr:AraC family transcriptional regulator [Pelomonas sp. KK5]
MLASSALKDRTVSNGVARAAMLYAEKAGLSPAQFSARTGIAQADLADPKGRIDGERHRRTVELMASLPLQLTYQLADGDAFFESLPLIGNPCLNAPTLRDALGSFARFRPIAGEFDHLLASHDAGTIRFEYIPEFAPSRDFQALFHFVALAVLVRAYDLGRETQFEVELTGDETPNRRHLAELFGTRPRFGCAANRMLFAAPHLDARASFYNSRIASAILQQSQQELQRIRRHGLAPVVEERIRKLIADDALDLQGAMLLQHLCAQLDTSRWSLNRRLQQEGTNFSQLELKVRLEESRRLLCSTSLGMAEISSRLGFTSQSAFTRFFRAQHGLAPTAFRQRAHGGEAV